MPPEGTPRARRNVLLATAAGAAAPLLLGAFGWAQAGPAVIACGR